MFNNALAHQRIILSLILLCVLISAPKANEELDDLTELSIEDLMFMEVTSVSKKNERLSEAAAAVYVVTKEDIRRSGVNHIAEALRMVPGLNVAQLDANKWAISSRGFNHIYSNKLLVLVDGRSVYSPLFSGVHWDVQDFVLEDIDRIEVIRGPGATLWGANAVNGVINIITTKANHSQGNLMSLGVGEHEAIASLRHGGKTENDIFYRGYFKGRNHPSNVDANGEEADDEWEQVTAGFRIDWEGNNNTHWAIHGDLHDGDSGERLNVPQVPIDAFSPNSDTFDDDMKVQGNNLIVKWTKQYSDNSELSIQTYYDSIDREEEIFEESHDTYDLELQHRYVFSDHHEFIWGMGYRHIDSETQGSTTYAFSPSSRTQELWNIFIQDEYDISPEKVTLIAGAKLEHNEFTGSEIQPNLRVIWTPKENQTIWGAVSRAVRTPSLNDMDARISASAFAYQFFNTDTFMMDTSRNEVRLFGNEDFESEELTAYELGYRITPNEGLSFDATTFYHQYDKLIGATFETPYFQSTPAPGHLIMPLRFTNTIDGYAAGLELAINWQPTRQWKLLAGYTYLDLELENDDLSNIIEKETPEQQFNLRSFFDITHDIELDTMLYFVDQLDIRNSVDYTNQKVDSYVRVDIRLGWHPSKHLAIDLGGRNLFDNQHAEFGTVPFVVATEAERSFYLKATWKL